MTFICVVLINLVLTKDTLKEKVAYLFSLDANCLYLPGTLVIETTTTVLP
jgi:hypothetical protein